MSNIYVSEIPDWDADGFLPVIHPVTRTESPYKISSEQLVAAMGGTSERRRLLRGWLDLRRELYGIGLVDGWQWVNGSFVENVEETEYRPPNDVDVTTFVRFPKNVDMSFWRQHIWLLDSQFTKIEFGVDAYYEDTERLPSELMTIRNRWHGLWSGTRKKKNRKGYIEVRLSLDDDREALELLNFKEAR